MFGAASSPTASGVDVTPLMTSSVRARRRTQRREVGEPQLGTRRAAQHRAGAHNAAAPTASPAACALDTLTQRVGEGEHIPATAGTAKRA